MTFAEIASQDHQCPACGKIMLLRFSSGVLISDPPQYPMHWRCGCGYRRFAGNMRHRVETEDEAFRREWETINQ